DVSRIAPHRPGRRGPASQGTAGGSREAEMNSLWLIALLASAGVSFFMSGMEAGVFALNRLRIRHRMREGNRRAAALHGYLENPEDFLWTILVGNTLANIGAVSIGVTWLHRWMH